MVCTHCGEDNMSNDKGDVQEKGSVKENYCGWLSRGPVITYSGFCLMGPPVKRVSRVMVHFAKNKVWYLINHTSVSQVCSLIGPKYSRMVWTNKVESIVRENMPLSTTKWTMYNTHVLQKTKRQEIKWEQHLKVTKHHLQHKQYIIWNFPLSLLGTQTYMILYH